MEYPDAKTLASAMKHYEALKRAQKKYYDKKAGPVESRRPRGRPKKSVAGGEGEMNGLENNVDIE